MSCECHMTVVQLVCTLVEAQDTPLAEQIMNNLLGRQVDANYVVRMYCIRGLGNMSSINETQVRERGVGGGEGPGNLVKYDNLATFFVSIIKGSTALTIYLALQHILSLDNEGHIDLSVPFLHVHAGVTVLDHHSLSNVGRYG